MEALIDHYIYTFGAPKTIREMYQVRDGFCFSAISLDWVNISSSYKDQIKANVFAQLLPADSILISYTEKKMINIFVKLCFSDKRIFDTKYGTPRKIR